MYKKYLVQPTVMKKFVDCFTTRCKYFAYDVIPEVKILPENCFDIIIYLPSPIMVHCPPLSVVPRIHQKWIWFHLGVVATQLHLCKNATGYMCDSSRACSWCFVRKISIESLKWWQWYLFVWMDYLWLKVKCVSVITDFTSRPGLTLM